MRFAGTISRLLFGLSFVLFAVGVSSAVAASPWAQAASNPVLTVPAGASASVNMRAFCLDPGKPFPNQVNNPTEVVKDEIRAALNYAASKGYDTSNPRQVQEAVWFLQTGNWQNPEHTLGQEIANAASDQANAVSNPSGTSVLDAATANNVRLSTSFTPASDVEPGQAFYGTGVLTVTNSTSQTLNVYLPFGAEFPPVDSTNQRLVGYALAVNQAAPTMTSAPTETPLPTNTAAPTATTAPAPTSTSVPTETPAPSSTPNIPNLPQTGAGVSQSGSGLPLGQWLIWASFMALIAGVILQRQAKHR